MRKLRGSRLVLLSSFILVVAVRAQDQSGFISIDCGLPEGSNYTDGTTGIVYSSDAGFTDSGISKSISPAYKSNSLEQQFFDVRSFPQGSRNCYTLKPAQGRNHKYLIRALFMYGNYDANGQPPEFDLQLDVDSWDTITVPDASSELSKEIIHVPVSDYVYVCLIDIGLGTPFISALELRPLNDSIYVTDFGSLDLFRRLDFGSTTNTAVRYKDDIYDREWSPFYLNNCTTLSTSFAVKPNIFQPPSIVMSTANVPQNASDSLDFYWETNNSSVQFYIYMYFAELESLKLNQLREFEIYLNGSLWYDYPFVPEYLQSRTVYSRRPSNYPKNYDVSIRRTKNSTLPPIINAIEIYTVKERSRPQTDEKEVSAIISIKSTYGVTRNWQGDPCSPKAYTWAGLKCSNDAFDPPRIISLNLSSSGLTGVIAPSISNLTMIQSLDLSNNNLTGQVPNFLSELAFLTVLNLRGNNFTGSVPAQLLEKSNNGSLSLSIDGIVINSTSPSQSTPSKKKNKFVAPVVSSVAAFLVLLTAFVIWWNISRRRKQEVSVLGEVRAEPNRTDSSVLELKKRQFAFSEVLKITNNFRTVLGKGGFGTVYHGYVGDAQVAVKMLSSSSTQGHKEFQAEAKLLINVHHKNLTSLVGYCNEGSNMALIYEFMVNGNLERHLSDKNPYVLSCEERLRIALDAAQGLEYLHNGCKSPIIHRDVKSTNILLNEKFQAKLADFGLSRVFPIENGSHVSTIVAGTPGYLDPEYYTSNRLTEKSDVYSFGVVLLEIITGRLAVLKSRENTHIVQWVSSVIGKGDIKNIADPRLRGDFDVNSVWKAVELAMACVSRTSSTRPTMNYVVMELKECLATEIARFETGSRDSIGVIPVNLELSESTPQAR